MSRSLLIGLILFPIACGPSPKDGDGSGDPGGGTGDPGGGTGPGDPPEFVDAAPAQACDKMDILFVIDNSGSMGQEQDNLAANFPKFIEVLNGFSTGSGQPLDYRVGITSTGITKSWQESTPIGALPDSQDGEDGELLQRCDMSRRWIERNDADPSATFACAALLGTGGANEEMPLEATRLAFGDRVNDGTNAGFLRDDALLAVVMLTDENDCSRMDNNFTLGFGEDVCDAPEPVPTYVQALDTVKGDRGRWATAVIAGPTSCSSDFGSAAEARRLKDFVQLTGKNAVFSSICEGDLSKALQDALETFDAACQSFPPID